MIDPPPPPRRNKKTIRWEDLPEYAILLILNHEYSFNRFDKDHREVYIGFGIGCLKFKCDDLEAYYKGSRVV